MNVVKGCKILDFLSRYYLFGAVEFKLGFSQAFPRWKKE